MKVFVPIFALLGAVCADEALRAKYSSYKAAHGKSVNLGAEQARLEAFSASLRLIDEHNEKFHKGEISYQLGLTPLSDMTPEEIRSTKLGAVINEAARASLNASLHEVVPAAGYVDWRGTAVTPVKNQDTCGSCYTFSSAGLLESALMMKGYGTYDLSEQDLVDCSYGRYVQGFNFGCNGGDPGLTIDHALQQGVAQEYQYSYTNSHGGCRAISNRVRGSGIFTMRRVSSGSESMLANALSRGPVAITLNGENNEFYNYVGGIYNNPACSTSVNHAVLLVGYGVQNGQEYWVIKNSWGSTWGENGFMRMAKGYNRCGIVSRDSFYVE